MTINIDKKHKNKYIKTTRQKIMQMLENNVDGNNVFELYGKDKEYDVKNLILECYTYQNTLSIAEIRKIIYNLYGIELPKQKVYHHVTILCKYGRLIKEKHGTYKLPNTLDNI